MTEDRVTYVDEASEISIEAWARLLKLMRDHGLYNLIGAIQTDMRDKKARRLIPLPKSMQE